MQPRATQPGIAGDGGDRLEGAARKVARLTRRVPADAHGQISLQCMPRQVPHFADVVHDFLFLFQVQAAWPTGSAICVAGTCSRNFGQSIRRNCPFMSSTNEVQLSTQSPSLQYKMPLMSRISARWICPQTTVSTPRLRAAWATASSKLPMY